MKADANAAAFLIIYQSRVKQVMDLKTNFHNFGNSFWVCAQRPNLQREIYKKRMKARFMFNNVFQVCGFVVQNICLITENSLMQF